MKQRIHIDRLDLDLRGIEPGLARAALQLLGPALQAQYAVAASAAAVWPAAGRTQAATTPQGLARQLAQRIAVSVAGAKED
jgi:hypothetical protein